VAGASAILETQTTRLAFALMLRDRVSGSDELLGKVSVMAETQPAQQNRPPQGVFVFLKLKDGAHVLNAVSDPSTPFYHPRTVAVTVPAPGNPWPAFPDVTLADPTLPLDDAGQPAAFRAQFAQTWLLPTTEYPFDPGATLLRGTVTQGGNALSNATVNTTTGTELPYVTTDTGEYVLFFEKVSGVPQTVTIKATHAGLVDKQQNVIVTRGATTLSDIAF
jgi:hypothetical protein